MTVTRRGQLFGELRYAAEFLTDGATETTYSTTQAKTGSYSYAFVTSTDPCGLSIAQTHEFRAGVWVHHNSVSTTSGEAVLFRWYHADATMSELIWEHTTGLIKIYENGVQKASVTPAAIGFNTLATWLHIALVVKGHASAGYITFYLNGVEALAFDGAVLQNTIAVYFGGRSATNGWNSTAYFDDFYVDDYTGETDSPPPSKRFLYVTTSGAGANSAWTAEGATPNYAAVDDIPPDGDTSLVKALTNGLRDTYQMGNISLPADHAIRAAIPLAIAKKRDAETNARLQLEMYDGATYATSADKFPNLAYTVLWDRMTTQPDTTAWNATDFDAMQAGIKSSGSF